MTRGLPAACALAANLAVLLPTRAAPAQEIQITGPLIGGAVTRDTSVEWSQWLAGGGGLRHQDGRTSGEGLFGVGVEATGLVHTYGGSFRLEATQFRGGAWASAVTDGLGMRGEGGALFLLCLAGFDPGISPAIRLGAGWGSDGLGRAAHLAATFTLGPRPPAGPVRIYRRPIAFVSGLRFFTTTRGALAGGAAYQVTFGVEIDPAFFAPPFGARKLKGQMPN